MMRICRSSMMGSPSSFPISFGNLGMDSSSSLILRGKQRGSSLRYTSCSVTHQVNISHISLQFVMLCIVSNCFVSRTNRTKVINYDYVLIVKHFLLCLMKFMLSSISGYRKSTSATHLLRIDTQGYIQSDEVNDSMPLELYSPDCRLCKQIIMCLVCQGIFPGTFSLFL